MRTTTDYISTYNTETSTTQRETTITLYTFDELSEEAQSRVVADYMEERENDPYFGQWFSDCYELEIWECVRDLEKSITGARVQWRYNRWYSCDFDCEYSYDDCYDPDELDRVDNNGYCYSMDLCGAWNAHVRKLNAIHRAFENVCVYMNDVDSSYDYWNEYTYEDRLYSILDNARTKLVGRWYEELEAACEDVRNTIETLLRGEWDYYTSEEYAREECSDESTQGGECYTCEYPYYKNGGYTGRVFYSDNRKWYTADGEFYEQSNVNHECVSIVKTA